MKTLLTAILAAALLLAAPTAHAQQTTAGWVSVPGTSNVYVAESPVVAQAGIILFWTRTESAGEGAQMTLYRAVCFEGTLAWVSAATVRADGKIEMQQEQSGLGTYPVPGTIAAAILQYACERWGVR